MARHNGLHNFLDFLDTLFEFLAKNCYSQNMPNLCVVLGLDTFFTLARHNGLHNFLNFLSSRFEFLAKNYYKPKILTVCLIWGSDTFVALRRHNGLHNFLDFLSSLFEFLPKINIAKQKRLVETHKQISQGRFINWNLTIISKFLTCFDQPLKL